MKYPQLVSPRAVNAISDWLVSRLEQLGVESPQIYTRLLLSLLQSSVQVNDPIEFSNLEAFFANRKGSHKRFHLPSDTETLKKLNAVQCLREIVSNEQETATIENLVDELCEKLKDIEKQTQNLNDEKRFLIETHLNTDSLLQTQTNTQQLGQHHLPPQPTSSNNPSQHHTLRHHYHHQQSHHHHQLSHQVTRKICNNPNIGAPPPNTVDSKRHHYVLGKNAAAALNDLENDPKKRYFRAFPALSKEMEDSFRIWRRNAKSLTWPIVGRSVIVDNLNNSSASLSSSSGASSVHSLSKDKGVEKKLKESVGHHLNNKASAAAGNSSSGGSNGNIGDSDVQQYQTSPPAAASSIKKKSKRRRNQGLCKGGKTIQNIRKLSIGTASNSVGVNKYHHYSNHRNSSPAWDTDFKGCWEMGPDLIKEFLSRQNGNKRNHSTLDHMGYEDDNEWGIKVNEMPVVKRGDSPIMGHYIDLSFCCDDDEINYFGEQTQYHNIEDKVDYVDEDYDDSTLASVSELTMDININPKRLYQREGHAQKSLAFDSTLFFDNLASGDSSLDDVADSTDPLDFQCFKAKFNSNVKALWTDAEPSSSISSQQPAAKTQTVSNSSKEENSLGGGGGISSAFYATTSLKALAPFKKDLWNFWSNYQQQQHFEQINNKLSITTSTSSMTTTTRLDNSSVCSGAGADIANSSDYFSMPSNLNDFDKSVGGVRRINEAAGASFLHTPSINVFLQNSIWSTCGDYVDTIGTTSASTAAVTDESFLFKVWHSNKKLSKLDVGKSANGEKMFKIEADSDGGVKNNDFHKSKECSSLIMNNRNLGANLQFPSYQNLKWSEGINAGPPYSGSLHSTTYGNIGHENDVQSFNNNSSLRTDNSFAGFSSVTCISGTTWKAPANGLSAQPDLKSWCASNPTSLTEMYGNDVCDSIVNQSPVEGQESNSSEMAIGPAVTLPNHCVNTSGFVEYSRIKQIGLVQPKTKPVQMSKPVRLPKDFFRSGEEENLLHSERTHFHPIDSFVDGHTFDIGNTLEKIEFERTSSGLMRYESEEYLEYTRDDAYISDEEVATTSSVKQNQSSFLKPTPDAAKTEKKKCEEFVIKFRFKRLGEIGCQTEQHDFQMAVTKMATASSAYPPPASEVNNMFHNTFSLSRQANNEAIMAAVTKAVAAAAKAAAENRLNARRCCWLPITNVTTKSSENKPNPLWRPDNLICDEVDFCKIESSESEEEHQLAQNWCMQQTGKQCQPGSCFSEQLHHHQQQQNKRKFPTETDIGKSEENSLDNTSLHTLWGMCAVCNSCEYDKSLPANRLLRDELELEADEIMSDLRYMQDLYIGESAMLNERNEVHTVNGENELEPNSKIISCYSNDMDMNTVKNPWNTNVMEQDEDNQNDPAKVSVLQKVGQLIEDLLKPENTGVLPKESFEDVESTRRELHRESTQLGNVWNLHSDGNIWQHKPLVEQLEGKTSNNNSESFAIPMELLKQVGDSLDEGMHSTESLNWEHDNLAKLWHKSIPASTQMEEILIENNQKEEIREEIIKNFIKEQDETEASQMVVEQKNLKNIQNSKALTPPSTLPFSTHKRVQQFLNNSSAKMKLVANRKRRHSASQNFYQQQHLQYNSSNSCSNNNNSDAVVNLNVFKDKLNCALKSQTAHHQQNLHQREVTPLNDTTIIHPWKVNAAEEQTTKQTIITCKYWTTATNGTQSSLDSAAAAMMLLAAATKAKNKNDILTSTASNSYDPEDVTLDENIFGNTFSCLIDKNASILKHMTVMARPLTR